MKGLQALGLALVFCLVGIAGCATLPQASVIDDFRGPLQWKANPDGGEPPALKLVKAPGVPGKALELDYVNGAHRWGNVIRPVKVPKDAAAIRFQLYVLEARPEAVLHVWLKESDNDAWVRRVTVAGASLGELAPGVWHEVRLPLSSFAFQKRGPGTPDLQQVTGLMLGCNFGSFRALVKGLQWVKGKRSPRYAPTGVLKKVTLSLAKFDETTERYLGKGWHTPDGGAAWTGKEDQAAELKLSALPPGDVSVLLDVDSAGVGKYASANPLEATVGTEKVASFVLKGPGAYQVRVPQAVRKRFPGAPLRLKVVTQCPAELGLVQDGRRLGMKVKRMELQVYKPTPASDLLANLQPPVACVVEDDLPGVNAAPAEPELLADLMKQAGYHVVKVKADDLARPGVLDPSKCKLLVLPNGPAFPIEAGPALVHYLQGGGNLLALGGYALDEPVLKVEGKWVGRNSLERLRGGAGLEFGEGGSDDSLSGNWSEVRSRDNLHGRLLEGEAQAKLQVGLAGRLQCELIGTFGPRREGTRHLEVSAGGQVIASLSAPYGVFDTVVPLPEGAVEKGYVEFTFKGTPGVLLSRITVFSEGKDETPADVAPETFEVHLNTHYGRAQDALAVEPTQIGVFDASYPLRFAVEGKPTDDPLAPQGESIRGKFEGWAAVGLLGSNSAVFPRAYGRYRPLISGYDEYGRKRGSLLSLLQIYAGPFAGSNWLISGVNSEDLTQQPLVQGALVKAARALLTSNVYFTTARPEFDAYYAGERVKVKCTVVNRTDADQAVQVKLQVFKGAKQLLATAPQVFTLTPGETKTVELGFTAPDGVVNLVRTEAICTLAGEVVDKYASGYVALSKQELTSGEQVSFRDNYFQLGGRPTYLPGTNQTGMVFCSAFETPLEWEQDCRLMQDLGLRVQRVLHLSPYVVSKTGSPPARPLDLNVESLPKWLERAYLGFTQLQQAHKVAFFISMHDWMGVALSPEELEAQRKYAELMGKLFKDVPGIIWDAQNEPSVHLPQAPWVEKEWNQFLQQKYKTQAAFAAAWGAEAQGKQLGKVPWVQPSRSWQSQAAADEDEFRSRYLLRRWLDANVSGLRQAGDAHPVTVGFLHVENAADKRAACGKVDFANTHFYGNLDGLITTLKLVDERAGGCGLSLGEYGAKVHSAWSGTPGFESIYGDSFKGAANWFLAVNHYVLGLGGSLACNWSFKDMADCLFPWGAVHNFDEVPKTQALALRAISYAFSRMEPTYHPEPLALVIPTQHRFGNSRGLVEHALQTSLHLMLDLHANFMVVDEAKVADLPPEVKVLVYPLPYCPSDDTYAQLKAFVERGGQVLITGDLTFDDSRHRTRLERLQELCGLGFKQELAPPGSLAEQYKSDLLPKAKVELDKPVLTLGSKPLGAKVLTATEAGPVLSEYALGKGRVVFCASPVELAGGENARRVYSYFLESAAVPELFSPVVDAGGFFHALRGYTKSGEYVVLFNKDKLESRKAEVSLGGHTFEVELAPFACGLVWCSNSGQVLAVEGRRVSVDGQVVLEAADQALACSLDGKELGDSSRVLLIPYDEGEVTFHGRQPLAAALGEIEQGKWRTFTRQAAARPVVLKVKPENAFDCWLLASEGEEKKAQAALEATARGALQEGY